MAHEPDKPRHDDVIVPTDAASAAYAHDLVRRGEAVRIPPGGTLPPGATHEIVGETPEGVPLLRRRRVALF
jgi:NADPH:quinone reductase-like Zn-dependent oxidoreductase